MGVALSQATTTLSPGSALLHVHTQCRAGTARTCNLSLGGGGSTRFSVSSPIPQRQAQSRQERVFREPGTGKD